MLDVIQRQVVQPTSHAVVRISTLTTFKNSNVMNLISTKFLIFFLNPSDRKVCLRKYLANYVKTNPVHCITKSQVKVSADMQ